MTLKMTLAFAAVLSIPMTAASVAQESNALPLTAESFGFGPVVEECDGTEFVASISGAADAKVYQLTATDKGNVTVRSSDCCIEGDIWRTELHTIGEPGKSKTGDGSVSDSPYVDPLYTGSVANGVQPGEELQLVVSYDTGTDVFTADAWICVEGPVTVSP